ncbi:hypothetical protein HHK36_023526 [Tetracentron sinense]|uniref:Peptide N-acetyl-beta-D-glucosaminyl asparaginase amidase A N-terminal domain-containing protein n=1 Tax=Tetracentron sinense TaxID=13715 RepID=A0A834YLJ6_TETSI|nr:hypothetical protein HHK36_023526 [Tetracentron sinense]
MASSLLLYLLFSLFLLHQPLSSNANIHKTKLLKSEFLSQASPKDTPITTFFQVTKPIKHPKTKPCSSLVLQHDFGFTYGKPPVLSQYKPPSNCPSQNFSTIVLEWKATCKGRQFDQIFGVWLGGVEILRSCTTEPRATGIVWTVEKDITRYSSLLKSPQTLAVFLGNVVDKTYTGIYHVNITLHFYPAEEHYNQNKRNSANSVYGLGSPADLILPISQRLQGNDGLWFLIENSTDVQLKEFKIPQNAYRAVLEVYVSFHENDEFWYGNPPNEYLAANNLTGTPGNGPFREVVISLDGKVVGAVWPFTVIYTGGINTLLWGPITGIGSFDLPSYDIEITPFLANIFDGKHHEFGFSVTDALNVWFIDANLHVWLDNKNTKTKGNLIEYKSLPLVFSLISDFKGSNGTFLTSASRFISATGWVKSSHGNITTQLIQEFGYVNSMEMGNNGNVQVVSQTIDANHSVYARLSSSFMYSIKKFQRFPLYLYTDVVEGIIVKGNLVSGLGSTQSQQEYNYEGTEECYFRNVSSTNYTIKHDKFGNPCSKKTLSGSGLDLAYGGLLWI